MTVKSRYGKEYTYDYDRSAYTRAYYRRNREKLLAKAIKRYRRIVTAKFQ